MSPEERDTLPAVGTLYVAPNGDAYRLRDYRPDMFAEPFTGEKTIPSYKVMLAAGMFTNADALPDGARIVWQPTDGPLTEDEARLGKAHDKGYRLATAHAAERVNEWLDKNEHSLAAGQQQTLRQAVSP